jgi:hypothetical protein
VRRAPRRDDDCVDILRRDELFSRRVNVRAPQPRGDFPRPGRIRVAEGDQARSNKDFGQPSNVLLPIFPTPMTPTFSVTAAPRFTNDDQ